MNQYRIVFTVLVVCISSIICQGTCPNGIQSTKLDCTGKELCPSGSICYRKNITRFCCGQLDMFCPTKMHAFNSEKSSSYLWGPSASEVKAKWYTVVFGNELIACPIPFSYAYSDYTSTVLPVDFDANSPETSKPKACNLNSDCNTDKDEFCGAAYHPTFSGKLDKSGKDGAPLKFCYKYHLISRKELVIRNLATSFAYEYDDYLSLISIQPVIEKSDFESIQISYDEKTGHKSESNGFSIIRDSTTTWPWNDLRNITINGTSTSFCDDLAQ